MMKMRQRWALMGAVLACAGGARADVLVLRNGQKLNGIVVSETDKRVVMRVSGTELAFSREQIASMERAEPEANDVLQVEASMRSGNVVAAMKSLADAKGSGVADSLLNQALLNNRASFLRGLEKLSDNDRVEARHQLARLRDAGFATPEAMTLLAQGFLKVDAPMDASDCLREAGLEDLRDDAANSPWIREFLRDLVRQLSVQGRYEEAVEQIERLRLVDSSEAETQLPLLYLASSARAREGGEFEDAARIIAEDLAARTPQIARNRASVTLRVLAASAQESGNEADARRLIQKYLIKLVPIEAQAAKQTLYAAQARRMMREGNPGFAVRLLESVPEEERTEEIEKLYNEVQFEARNSEMNPNDPEAIFDLGEWAVEKGLTQQALTTFDRLKANADLRMLADGRMMQLRRERDIAALREALAAYDAGLMAEALSKCEEILKSESHESQVSSEAKKLAELARKEMKNEDKRKPYQAEALFQQAERAFFMGNVDESWKLIDMVLRDYSDTPAAERAANLLPDVAREIEVEFLEGRRHKVPNYQSAVPRAALKQSEELDKEIRMLMEAL